MVIFHCYVSSPEGTPKDWYSVTSLKKPEQRHKKWDIHLDSLAVGLNMELDAGGRETPSTRWQF